MQPRASRHTRRIAPGDDEVHQARLRRVRRLVVLVAAVHLLFAPGVQAQFKSVRVQVIDRGQANGNPIRSPNSQWVVIDAGANNQQADAMAKVWSVEKLALVITLHRHADHYVGMAQILSRFPVDSSTL